MCFFQVKWPSAADMDHTGISTAPTTGGETETPAMCPCWCACTTTPIVTTTEMITTTPAMTTTEEMTSTAAPMSTAPPQPTTEMIMNTNPTTNTTRKSGGAPVASARTSLLWGMRYLVFLLSSG